MLHVRILRHGRLTVFVLQAGGQAARWILYHHTHLVERCIRTMKAAVPAGSPVHPLAQHAGGRGWECLGGGSRQLQWCIPCSSSLVRCFRFLPFCCSTAEWAVPQLRIVARIHALHTAATRICVCPFIPAAEWAVPQMLRIVACIHALYTPAGRQALAPIGAALEMAPQVRTGWGAS